MEHTNDAVIKDRFITTVPKQGTYNWTGVLQFSLD